jgi:hypothetical protein
MDVSILAKLAPAVIAFVAGVLVRPLLDLELAPSYIRSLSWIPSRGLFRSKQYSLAGMWDQHWHSESEGFADPHDRHGQTKMYQFFRYCYAEFYAQKKKYVLLGHVRGDYLIGRWYDPQDEKGYFGTFHLEIVGHDRLRGKWTGHSKATRSINTDRWEWTRIST